MVDSFGFNDGIEQQEEDNRIRQYLSELNNRTNDPEEMMLEIMDTLPKLASRWVPSAKGESLLQLVADSRCEKKVRFLLERIMAAR